MRALIVYEDSHRSYGEAMESAIRAVRPRVEVALIHLQELEGELERFDPHLVVCSQPNTVDPGTRAAWVWLSDDPNEPSEVCIDAERWRLQNPGLEEILTIIDETEELVRMGRELRGC